MECFAFLPNNKESVEVVQICPKLSRIVQNCPELSRIVQLRQYKGADISCPYHFIKLVFGIFRLGRKLKES